ncbi:MAG: hypothetical protein NWE89_03695 [Candidatus Bathyarchaeota archaeon]|nr:hypothetical protein [Candidatus Bathyarchaeota archaeon]
MFDNKTASISLVVGLLIGSSGMYAVSLGNDKSDLVAELSEENLGLENVVQELSAQVSSLEEMVSVYEEAVSGLEARVCTLEAEARLSYARVVEAKKVIVYLSDGYMNYSYVVEYRFPNRTEAVFSVRSFPELEVIESQSLWLEGQSTIGVSFTVPLPDEMGKWSIAPSVCYVVDGEEVYSEDLWYQQVYVDVIEGVEDHRIGTCGDTSSACHSSVTG